MGCTDQPVVLVDRSRWRRVLVCLPCSVSKQAQTRSSGSQSRLGLRPDPVGTESQPTGFAGNPGEHRFRMVLSVEGAPAGYHVIRFTVTGPDGQERACDAANVAAERGVGEHV